MDISLAGLKPLPYQEKVRNYLKSKEPELWNWFSSTQFQKEYADNVRLELLKGSYRLDRETHGELYAQAEDALRRLNLAIPPTLYQAQLAPALNAALSYLPGEGHLIFSGPILTTLKPAELGCLFGHEFSHYRFFADGNGEFLIADQILHALASSGRAEYSHVESCRLFRLYTEIFADRGALVAYGDPMAAISTLIKIETGLAEVNPDAYLRQAEEIFSKERSATRELTHPEAYIRARALKLWADRGEAAETEIAAMIEGSPGLDNLDLVRQVAFSDVTRAILGRFFSRPALRSEALLAHARLYFDDFQPPAAPPSVDVPSPLDSSMERYFGYLLLDFAAADPTLEDLPLAAAVLLSRELRVEETFLAVVSKELKRKKRELEKLREKAEEIVAKAGGGP